MTVLVGITARSIQHYVFTSNALRDVIGASQVVSDLLDHQRLREDFGETNTLVLASGGGVTIVRVNDDDQARAGIERFSRRRLRTAPGLDVALAIQQRTPGSLAGDLAELHARLADRSTGTPPDAQIGTPAGIARCSTTGRARSPDRHEIPATPVASGPPGPSSQPGSGRPARLTASCGARRSPVPVPH